MGNSSPAHCVCANLRKASRAITQLYDDALRPAGIRSTQFNILADIHAAGEATLVELAGRLLLDQTTLTRSLRLLEEMGLLTRAPRQDARVKALKLTPAGGTTFRRAVPLWKAVQDDVVRSIGGAAAWTVTREHLKTLAESATALTADEK